MLHYALPKYVFNWKFWYICFLLSSYYSTASGLYLRFYWYFFSSYNGLFIDMIVYVVQYNCWLYCILDIFLYISYVWVIITLYCRYIHNFINMFVNVISMFTAIHWCNSYYLLLGCAPSWEAFHAYFLCIICYFIVSILIDLNSQNWIHIYLFELFFTFIKTHILVPNFSISHIFPSIIVFSVVSYYW